MAENNKRSSNLSCIKPAIRYSVILADPPWAYRDKCVAGHRGASFKYPCMSLTELSCLVVGEWPVQDIGADDSALFLWTTAPMFNTALQLMGAWEYDYKTVAFTWVKPTAGGHWAWGMGNHTRANAEFCLLGMRGRLRRVSASVHSLVVAMRREHSRKPDEVRDRITKLYGDVPRIELFARGQAADGWDCHGDEVLR